MKRLLLALMLLWLAALVQPALAADTVYYYYTNTLRSAVVETDAQGNIVERTTYYAPYGQVLNRSMRDGPGYTGHEEDPATGLNYMQQRYYDPQSGRFVSSDPVVPTDDGANFNRYEYANDNPYRYTDPDGRESGAGYATGEYTIALPPSSPEARDAALMMMGMAPVVGDVQNVVDAYNNPSVATIAIAAVGLVPEAGPAIADVARIAKVAKEADVAARDAGKAASGLRNGHLAGSVHPKTGIPFTAGGHPDFSGVAKAEVKITQTGTRAGDFRAANEAAGFKSTPEGHTWHHHQDGTTMQLVPRDIHAQTGHTGGFQPRCTNNGCD